MSLERRKRRISGQKGKELFDLFVSYLYATQDKNKKEVAELTKSFNNDWLAKCKQAKRDVVDFNPKGFQIMISNKRHSRKLRKELGLKSPKSWFQNLFS